MRRNPAVMTGKGLRTWATLQNARPLTITSMTSPKTGQPQDVVPGIEYGARGLRFDDQQDSAAQSVGDLGDLGRQ
jgi:hypothetical protein